MDADSPLEPARRVAGEVFGPIETGAAAALRPFIAVPDVVPHARLHAATRSRELEAENARLRSEASTAGYDRNRLEEFDGLTTAAERPRLRPGPGPRGRRSARAQSFSRTVTIDAGSPAGVGARHDRASTTTASSAGCSG